MWNDIPLLLLQEYFINTMTYITYKNRGNIAIFHCFAFTVLSGISAKIQRRPEKIKINKLAFIFLFLYLYSNNHFLT